MSRFDADPGLLPSVLDRLIDREPRVSSGPEDHRGASLSELKASVKRDLEWLLNARRPLLDLPPGASPLRDSLLTYGLPDFTHANLGRLEDKGELRRLIEEAVARFEPRLTRVAVSMLEGSALDRNLRFRIDAVLDIDPTPEAITFDSVIRVPTNTIEVKDG